MQKRNLIIGAVIMVMLIAGIIAVSLISPEESDTETNVTAEPADNVILKLETADEIILDTENNDIKFVNSNGTWSIDGINDGEADNAKIKSFVFSALSYMSTSVLEGTEADYGLDKPEAVISIKDGNTQHTVKIGDMNAVGNGCFASADGVSFVMGTAQRERLLKDSLYYTTFSRISVNIDDINSIIIENAQRSIELYLPDEIKFEGNIWQMRKPYQVMANDAFIDSEILPALEAVTLSEKTDKLGKVQSKVIFKTPDKEYVFTLGSSESGKTAVEYEGEIYSEPSELFAFTDAELFEYMNKLVSYVHIDDVNSVKMEYDGNSHSLKIDGDTFIADGVSARSDASRLFYTYLIGITANGLYNNEELGESLLNVTFNCKDNEAVTVEYRRINEYTAAVVRNGEVVFVTGFYDIEDLISKIETFYK